METKKKILLVEDDQLMRMELAQSLSDAGFEVTAEETAEKGLTAFGEVHPDACVFDIMLPGKSGLDLLEDIRITYPNDTTPVYFLTSTADMEYVSRAVEGKAAGYINKSDGAIANITERLKKHFA